MANKINIVAYNNTTVKSNIKTAQETTDPFRYVCISADAVADICVLSGLTELSAENAFIKVLNGSAKALGFDYRAYSWTRETSPNARNLSTHAKMIEKRKTVTQPVAQPVAQAIAQPVAQAVAQVEPLKLNGINSELIKAVELSIKNGLTENVMISHYVTSGFPESDIRRIIAKNAQ